MEQQRPPGPIGIWHTLKTLRRLVRDFLGTLRELHAEYGDVVCLRLGRLPPIYLLAHPDHVGEGLVEKAGSFHKPTRFRQAFSSWIGKGLIINEGADWLRQRRLMQAVLQRYDPFRYAATVVEQTAQHFRPATDESVSLNETIDRLAFAISTASCLGPDLQNHFESFLKDANLLNATGVQRAMWNWSPSWAPTPGQMRIRAALASFNRLIFEAIRRRRALADPGDDLLGLMISTPYSDNAREFMTDQALRDEAVSVILGGKETAASASLWFLYLLAKHPQVQEELIREIDEVLDGQDATWQDLSKLTFVERAWKEAIRLYPPTYTISREAAEPLSIGGVAIAQRSTVIFSVFAMHRDPRWFDNPDAFRPERFFPEAERALQRHAYVPFGAGPRICVGKGLAWIQGLLLTATVLQRYRLQLPANFVAPEYYPGISLYPKHPLRLRAIARPQRAGPVER